MRIFGVLYRAENPAASSKEEIRAKERKSCWNKRRERKRKGKEHGRANVMARQKGERRVKERSSGESREGEEGLTEGSGTGVSDEGAAFELRGRPKAGGARREMWAKLGREGTRRDAREKASARARARLNNGLPYPPSPPTSVASLEIPSSSSSPSPSPSPSSPSSWLLLLSTFVSLFHLSRHSFLRSFVVHSLARSLAHHLPTPSLLPLDSLDSTLLPSTYHERRRARSKERDESRESEQSLLLTVFSGLRALRLHV